jgi:hypothetical protein
VLLGDGMRLFDPSGLGLGDFDAIELTPVRTVQSPDVTHIRYRVAGQTMLTGDERFTLDAI